MRELRILLGAMLVLALAAGGCAKKAEQAAESAGDSLLAANPVEPPQGNMTPSQDYQQPPADQQAPPTPAVKPAAPKPAAPKPASKPVAPANPGVTVPEGTALKIAVNAQITSETAQVGDAWEGKVSEPLVIGTAAPIPAGSVVKGVVKAVKPAEKGDRAMLQLAITSVEVEGRSHAFNASTEEMIAGSTRTRNVGTVAGGAAAGALLGKAIGGGGKGALIGGLLGGAAATGVVASTKGYQVVIKEGSELSFTVNEAVTMKQ
jgi:hypothetical protein